MARTASGGILAWVQGTLRYATQVEIAKKKLSASCTCPYGGTCKHAVALVLSYLECVKSQKEIPTATEDDPRFDLLQEAAEAAAAVRAWEPEGGDDEDYNEDDEDYGEDEYDEHDEDDEDDKSTLSRRPVVKRSHPPVSDGATAYLEQQSKDDLVALLKELMRQHPDVRQAIVDRANLLSGEVKKLVATVRKEINALARMPAWGDEDDWGHGSSGNYTRIRTHLEALLAAGHADEVLSLGQELLKTGTQQVEMINDEGETQGEVATCMNIVFRALTQSSLPPAERMLWAIDAELGDGYDLCQGKEEFWQHSFSTADWNIVADHLHTRLRKFASENRSEEYPAKYRRDHLSNLLIQALEQAGRKDEIIPLCEREVEKTDSYVRLVTHLKQAKRWREMEQWIHKGIAATRKQLPGIASQLRLALRERREQQKNWPQVAAFYAEDFFDQPGARTLIELQKAAKRAGVEAEVRAGAFHYLETGTLPQATKSVKKTGGVPPWPLPECEVKGMEERGQTTAPMRDALIDIAIAEKRPDDVLRWYDQRELRKTPTWGYGGSNEDRIATAIVDAYPDRAIAIWKKLAEAQFGHAEVRAYETAATYLRKVRDASKKPERAREWTSYLAALRQANLRRPRLVQILDSLTGRPIVEM
ncbi:MAG TPA: SWIM zinc finger family protein [Candidatus Binatia bacterium]|nr:SWIM zinc finger family protein [Candidatus Binatia bacterium]